MLVDDGLQDAQEPSAERRGDLSGHVAMLDGIFFPDEATEVLAVVLEVGLEEVLQVLVLWRVDVGEGLRPEESELIGCDPDDRSITCPRLSRSPRATFRRTSGRHTKDWKRRRAPALGNGRLDDSK